jgi:hypothetical protein
VYSNGIAIKVQSEPGRFTGANYRKSAPTLLMQIKLIDFCHHGTKKGRRGGPANASGSLDDHCEALWDVGSTPFDSREWYAKMRGK